MKKKIIFSTLFLCSSLGLLESCSKKPAIDKSVSTVAHVSNTQNFSEEQPEQGVFPYNAKPTRATVVITNDPCGTAANKVNCVLFARCKKPSLPFGLFTYQNKLNIINSYTPGAGKVAIINVGTTSGHVAYVKSVSGSGSTAIIYLRDANWLSGKITDRDGTASQLKIVGYFN